MTRMFMLPPNEMCENHLRGEHGEIHQLVGMIKAEMWPQIQGQIQAGNIDLSKINVRHQQLEKELGYNSDPPHFGCSKLRHYITEIGEVDLERSRRDLKQRCSDCRELIQEAR